MGSYSKQGQWQLSNNNIPIQCYGASYRQTLAKLSKANLNTRGEGFVVATNTLIANDDPLVIEPFLPKPATQEPNQDENNEEEDFMDEEDILPLPEETLPTQNNMDITRVKEQGDDGDESHQRSPETSLSPEIVAPGHAADRLMVVYDSDSGGLEDHDVPPPPFLEGSSSTPLTLIELLDNFSTVDMESTSDEEMLDAVARHLEFHWAGGEIFLRIESVLLKLGLSKAQYEDVFCDNTIQQLLVKVSINVPPSIVESTIAWFIEKRDLRRNWAAAQQLRELFDTVETLYWKEPRIGILGCQCILGRCDKKSGMWLSLWDGCYSKCSNVMHREVPDKNDRQLAQEGLYKMDLKACMPHIWNALNQLRGASSLKEEGDWRKFVDSILKNPAITDYNVVLKSDSPNLVKVFRVRTIIPPAEFINCLIFDQDFEKNFRS
ncbi:hypothetical protein SELMODRAFT_421537 [Selaginella moellendorffii]|uniref:Uncharacterized protein n=1 Tax=Selaginella moellendorffii TaxID=88036 RepID=D8SFK9_SELML|nr:hypothetical protein SELMODRAFT_421537 [Selaginella moellendorffii]